MKKIALGAALTAIVGAASLSAQAADGTITITGEITASTCSITPIGASGSNIDVDFGKISEGSMAGANAVSAPRAVNFNIEATAGGTCAAGDIDLDFAATDLDSNGNIKNTLTGAGASNVVAQLMDENGNVMDLRATKRVTLQTGTNNLNWKAQLLAPSTGGASEGEFNGAATLQISVP